MLGRSTGGGLLLFASIAFGLVGMVFLAPILHWKVIEEGRGDMTYAGAYGYILLATLAISALSFLVALGCMIGYLLQRTRKKSPKQPDSAD